MYAKYFKRILDILCALLAVSCFCWLYIILAILVKVKLGSPVLFTQLRPGKKDENGVEQIFKLYKFRTMTDEKDEQGKLLPDKVRLTKFGRWLRSTSLDELPEAFNILRGDMSIIGPRPQLVRDMMFMTPEQRKSTISDRVLVDLLRQEAEMLFRGMGSLQRIWNMFGKSHFGVM
ncbi:MAG: sugar transferase [Lachnospiraceae bacterium]